jgi:hypothetical protein
MCDRVMLCCRIAVVFLCFGVLVESSVKCVTVTVIKLKDVQDILKRCIHIIIRDINLVYTSFFGTLCTLNTPGCYSTDLSALENTRICQPPVWKYECRSEYRLPNTAVSVIHACGVPSALLSHDLPMEHGT